jgi:hypothetical protein
MMLNIHKGFMLIWILFLSHKPSPYYSSYGDGGNKDLRNVNVTVHGATVNQDIHEVPCFWVTKKSGDLIYTAAED